MATSSAPTDRRSGPPLWLVEGLDIVESRRRIVLGVAGLIIVVGLLLALLAPGVLPPTPLVGAAVALAALLIGVAAAIVVDSSDLRVRGPRHVVAAGGELVAVLPVAVDQEAADDLATVVLEARQPDRSMLLGLAASSLDIAATLRWTDALGLALARRGVSVLRLDLASGRSDTPGLAEVAAGERRLTEVVDYETGVLLARLGAGGDHRAALAALVDLPAKLPRDLEVLLVALPIAASRGVVQAARGLDHVLVVAERGDTSRVDLIAGLDALRAADLQAQVVLLDDLTAERIADGGTAAEVVPVRSRPDADAEPASIEPTDESAPAPVTEPLPASEPTDESAPEPVTEPLPASEAPVEGVSEPVTEPLPASEPTDDVEPSLQGTAAPTPPEPPSADVTAGAVGSTAYGADATAEETDAPSEEAHATAGEADATVRLEDPVRPTGDDVSVDGSRDDQTARLPEAADDAPPADHDGVGAVRTPDDVPPEDVIDDEPDADGPPPPPAIALAAATRTPSIGSFGESAGGGAGTRELPADRTERTDELAVPPEDRPEEAEPPIDGDDAAARVAAIVRAVLREHEQPPERSTPRP